MGFHFAFKFEKVLYIFDLTALCQSLKVEIIHTKSCPKASLKRCLSIVKETFKVTPQCPSVWKPRVVKISRLENLSFSKKKKSIFYISTLWLPGPDMLKRWGWMMGCWYRGRIFLSIGFLSTGALHLSRVALSLLDTHRGTVSGPRWTGLAKLRVTYRLL